MREKRIPMTAQTGITISVPRSGRIVDVPMAVIAEEDGSPTRKTNKMKFGKRDEN